MKRHCKQSRIFLSYIAFFYNDDELIQQHGSHHSLLKNIFIFEQSIQFLIKMHNNYGIRRVMNIKNYFNTHGVITYGCS